jgi:divalent metal cation (Fe/Co/Zn/Cd) transporter
VNLALVTLAGATVLITLASEVFVESVQQAATALGISPAFVGFIVVALVGNGYRIVRRAKRRVRSQRGRRAGKRVAKSRCSSLGACPATSPALCPWICDSEEALSQ